MHSSQFEGALTLEHIVSAWESCEYDEQCTRKRLEEQISAREPRLVKKELRELAGFAPSASAPAPASECHRGRDIAEDSGDGLDSREKRPDSSKGAGPQESAAGPPTGLSDGDFVRAPPPTRAAKPYSHAWYSPAQCEEGRSCVEEAVLARALLGPDAWLRDGDFNPDMRGLYSVDDLCIYVDDPDRGRRPVPLEEAREHILLDDATAPFLRLAGKIRPLDWVDGAEDAIACDRCACPALPPSDRTTNVRGASDIMGTDSMRASAVDWNLLDWEACFDRRQGGSPGWVPVHVVTTCFELRVRSFHDVRARPARARPHLCIPALLRFRFSAR